MDPGTETGHRSICILLKQKAMESRLLVPEELFLITVHETEGRTARVASRKFDILLAAAILMVLALRRKVDTDPELLFPDQPGATGHPLLDRALDRIRAEKEPRPIAHWLLRLAEEAPRLRKELIDGLAAKGLIRLVRERVFLGFASRTYPRAVDDRESTEVKSRIRELVDGDGLPELHDMVIVSLAWYGGLFSFLMPEEQIAAHRARIEQLARMDLVGQSIAGALHRLSFTLTATMRAKELLGVRTPEEKFDELAEEMMMVMHTDEAGLPAWLRKGTPEGARTLAYIRETGTREITFNPKTGTYGLKMWAAFPGS